jgi:hypothetical protein
MVDRLYVALSDSCTLVRRRRRSGERMHGRRIGSRGEKKQRA